jgi:hypothetical protein
LVTRSDSRGLLPTAKRGVAASASTFSASGWQIGTACGAGDGSRPALGRRAPRRGRAALRRGAPARRSGSSLPTGEQADQQGQQQDGGGGEDGATLPVRGRGLGADRSPVQSHRPEMLAAYVEVVDLAGVVTPGTRGAAGPALAPARAWTRGRSSSAR